MVSLDVALRRWVALVRDAVGVDLAYKPGVGAAGGVGFGALTVLSAALRPGIELVLDLVDFAGQLAGAGPRGCADMRRSLPRVAKRAMACAWCGREVVDTPRGRRRRYCGQSCRQRAYEQRQALAGTALPPDAVVLTAEEADAFADRAFALRCAVEDVSTAVSDGASPAELSGLCAQLLALARAAERLR